MADLAKLYAARQAKPDFEGLIAKQVEVAVKRISSGITDNVKQHTQSTEQRQSEAILEVVKTIQPELSKAISEGIKTVLADIAKIESLDELKGLVKAIKVPDYSKELKSIKAEIVGKKIPKTDLAPVMSQLSTISEQLSEDIDDDPKEWVFDVKRDSITKLIDTVEVVAK